jgi:hypothetical protein
VKGHATGPVAIGVAGTGVANVAATIDAKGTGTITLAGTSTGAVNVGSMLTTGTGANLPVVITYAATQPAIASTRAKCLFICHRALKLVAAYQQYSVASSAAETALLEKLTGTTAPGSGTACTNAVALNGAADTVLTHTIVTAGSADIFAAGDRVGWYASSATLTSLNGHTIVIVLIPV